jgi:serine/threonine-protein kinase HipA
MATQQRTLLSASGSLGGAKPKAVIAIDGHEWVLKFYNGEPVDLPLVEHATMTLASLAGLQVAQTLPVRLVGSHALAVKRFDRTPAGGRVHCLSACTVLRAETPAGQEPEFGYPQLARALRRQGDVRTLDADLRDLFCRMVFNILMANTDDHEKNHALLCHVDGRTVTLRLSPGFDMVPTGSGALAHEFMVSDNSHEPNLTEALRTAETFGLSAQAAASDVRRIIDVVNTWQVHFRDVGVAERDIQEIAATVDAPHLLGQRERFSKHTAIPPLSGRGKRPKKAGGAFWRSE